VRALVAVQHELNQPAQERKRRASRVLVCGFEQSPRPVWHHAASASSSMIASSDAGMSSTPRLKVAPQIEVEQRGARAWQT
jgi:hypothetical protein